MTVSIHDLRAWKSEGRRFVMLTAYDFPTAQILDHAGVPVLQEDVPLHKIRQ